MYIIAVRNNLSGKVEPTSITCADARQALVCERLLNKIAPAHERYLLLTPQMLTDDEEEEEEPDPHMTPGLPFPFHFPHYPLDPEDENGTEPDQDDEDDDDE